MESIEFGYDDSANVHRRHLTKGQQAMATALAYPEATNKGGRGKKAETTVLNTDVSSAYLKHARFVLRHCRDKAESGIDLKRKNALSRLAVRSGKPNPGGRPAS